jgi:dienelactone hydrolase
MALSVERLSLASGAGALALTMALVAAPARAQLQMEVIPVEATTLTARQVMLGDTKGEPVRLAGELRLPRPGTGRVPVVVLVHGIGGLKLNQDEWARLLNDWGYGAFLLDSLSGRGITAMSLEDYRLSELTRMPDLYRALSLLAKHPRVDPDRIAVMGFSRGATTTLLAGDERFRRQYGPADLQFAAYVALYPSCTTRYRDDAKVAARPVRIFHGTGDDWTPIEPCRALVADMKKAGADVTLTEFPGATHAYDSPAARERTTIPQAFTARKCSVVEGENGQLVNARTGEPFLPSDACVERGVTVQYDEAATQRTRDAVKAALTAAFATRP